MVFPEMLQGGLEIRFNFYMDIAIQGKICIIIFVLWVITLLVKHNNLVVKF